MKRGRTLFFAGLAIALIPTLARYYLLWPLPGSQTLESMRWAYTLSHVVLPAQILGGLLAAVGLVAFLRQPAKRKTRLWVAATAVASLALYGFTVRYSAPTIFKPLLEPRFATGTSDELPPETLVLGIRSGEVAKAYPIRLIAYHHQVTDELDGEPIWVTYCTMCRTGKVFRPLVGGRPATFDLLGAVRYNSIYRDSVTGSYWYQANGRAVAGPAAGEVLKELRSDQMSLARWLEMYPESRVLQPDPAHADGYRLYGFDTFDERRSDPENPIGWQWVVGVRHGDVARGYAWSMLAGDRLLQDEIGDLPIAIHLLPDDFSHRAWDRRLDGRVLDLRLDAETDRLIDDASGSSFGFDGVAVGGELDGQRLRPVPSTVEYRHSFEYFSDAEIVEGSSS
jgi:hypothetical protein